MHNLLYCTGILSCYILPAICNRQNRFLVSHQSLFAGERPLFIVDSAEVIQPGAIKHFPGIIKNAIS